MNLYMDTDDYDHFINIDTTNYIERYDDRNNPVYYKDDDYNHQLYSKNNTHNLVFNNPYKNIDYNTQIIIMHIIGGCVICIATIIFINDVYQ